MANFCPAPISSWDATKIYYQGPEIEKGALPAIFFFALSGWTSLYEATFRAPILELSREALRIFSWDLPFHGPHEDPKQAMQEWVKEFLRNPNFISDFILRCRKHIDFLIDQGYVDFSRMGVAGISRGAFIATHLAAKDQRLKTLLGFAPLTKPQPLEEFCHLSGSNYEILGLSHLSDDLIHKQIRFYIGNHDLRVGTKQCFEFIEHVVDEAIAKGVRSPQIELMIYPSVGYKGHGTPSYIFEEGSNWLKFQLLK